MVCLQSLFVLVSQSSSFHQNRLRLAELLLLVIPYLLLQLNHDHLIKSIAILAFILKEVCLLPIMAEPLLAFVQTPSTIRLLRPGPPQDHIL